MVHMKSDLGVGLRHCATPTEDPVKMGEEIVGCLIGHPYSRKKLLCLQAISPVGGTA